jgi:hypothetical protein
MTNVRQRAIGAAAVVALVMGALLASGAVSFAQTSTVTPTPAATSAPTTVPSGSSGSATPAPGSGGSTHNCPNMGTGGSSGSGSSYHSMTPSSSSSGA